MTRFVAWANLLSLFGVGILIGGLAVHIHHGRSSRAPERPPWAEGERPASPRHGGGPIVERLAVELDLSEAQIVELRKLMTEAREAGERLRRETRPRLLAQLQATHEQILELLDEEQRERFEELAPDPEQLARDLFRRGPGPRGKRPPRRERR